MMTKRSRGPSRTSSRITKKQSVENPARARTLAAKQARWIVFPGVGKLVVVKRQARMGPTRRPARPSRFPAKTVLKFRIAKAMKELALK